MLSTVQCSHLIQLSRKLLFTKIVILLRLESGKLYPLNLWSPISHQEEIHDQGVHSLPMSCWIHFDDEVLTITTCPTLPTAAFKCKAQTQLQRSVCLTFSCSMFFLCCLIFFTSTGRSGIPFPASSSCSAAYSRQKTPVRPTPELRHTDKSTGWLATLSPHHWWVQMTVDQGTRSSDVSVLYFQPEKQHNLYIVSRCYLGYTQYLVITSQHYHFCLVLLSLIALV